MNVNAYFDRIFYAGSIAPNLATLEALVAAHAAHIPFENIDSLVGTPIALELKAIERKMLGEKRGGFCLEHNVLIAAVLADLDFDVVPAGAQVLLGRGEDDAEPTVDHMVIIVTLGGSSYLVDVGFGGLTPTAPLRLREGTDQATGHETYRLIEEAPAWRLEVRLAEGDWRPVYRFTRDPFDPETVNRTIAGDASLELRRELRVALAPPGRRHALKDARLTTYMPREPGEPSPAPRVFTSVEDLRKALSETFGLALPQTDAIHAVLDAAVTRTSAQTAAPKGPDGAGNPAFPGGDSQADANG